MRGNLRLRKGHWSACSPRHSIIYPSAKPLEGTHVRDVAKVHELGHDRRKADYTPAGTIYGVFTSAARELLGALQGHEFKPLSH